jgi:hypothetical protein
LEDNPEEKEEDNQPKTPKIMKNQINFEIETKNKTNF